MIVVYKFLCNYILLWCIFNEIQTKVIYNSRQYEQLSNNIFSSVTNLTVVTDFSYFLLLKEIYDLVLLISSVRFIENITKVTKQNCSLTLWSTKFIQIKYKYSASISQATHLSSITQTKLLILFRDMITVSSENHIKHINTFCRKNAELLIIRQVVYIVITVL
jgi:hypothetical protein